MARTAPRRRWPPGVLRGVVADLMRDAPRHLLQRALWGGAGSAADALRRGRAYARSAAVMSMVQSSPHSLGPCQPATVRGGGCSVAVGYIYI